MAFKYEVGRGDTVKVAARLFRGLGLIMPTFDLVSIGWSFSRWSVCVGRVVEGGGWVVGWFMDFGVEV